MRKLKKGIALFIVGVSLFTVGYSSASAAGRQEEVADNSSEGLVLAEVVVPQEEVFAVVTRATTGGTVDGDGVRLRASASSGATVLELMYNKESVAVDKGASVSKNGVLWYYLKRVKTGTWGYADSDYIKL